MSQSFLTPDRLFDRPWQPGHAFGRKTSLLRRALMMVLFLVLCSIIAGYLYLTDADRVRTMAQQYLTQLIGGKITVGGANLSIFEGLRLKDVKIAVDGSDAPDATLFSAQQFHIKYGIRELLAGRIEAAQIVAVEPHVYLTENVDSGTWNYQRLTRQPRGTSKPSRSARTLVLPEIMLRNAQVDYTEVRNGEANKRASVAIEAHCIPSADSQRFKFELQSRADDSATLSTMGPTASGWIDRDMKAVTVIVHDIELLRLSSMLPNQVREFTERHKLRGRVDVPVLVYQPARDGHEPNFRVVMKLGDVKLRVQPHEWLSTKELARQQWTIDALRTMSLAGMNSQGSVDYLTSLVEAAPIELDKVSGEFEFTQEGIAIRGMKGRIEENFLNIDGEIKGYSPTSPVSIRVASDPAEHIVIPTAPRYVSALPRGVLDIYDAVRPWGKCDLKVALERRSEDSRLEVAGAVDIVDGGLCYNKFAYPLRNAHGRIQFGPDSESGMDCVKLVNIQGKGVKGGPNENVVVTVNGLIGPLPGEPAVDVRVSAEQVTSEAALTRAFPSEVHEAFKFLDADGKGLLPTFTASFVCKVHKNIDAHKVNIDTTVELHDAEGKISIFPYPLQHVAGTLHIVDGAVDIRNAHMKRSGGELAIDGNVSWRAGVGRALEKGEKPGELTKVRPDIKISAKNVPVDHDLLTALPGAHRAWLQKLGAAGRFDLDGRVHSMSPSISQTEEITHEFEIALRDASLYPVGKSYAVTNLSGSLHLAPSRLELRSLKGKRGAGDLAVSGAVDWTTSAATLALRMLGQNITLDPMVYQILPEGARNAWDHIHPEGTVDAEVSYSGSVALSGNDDTSAKTQASTHPSGALAGLNVSIRPRNLAVTLSAFPLRLEDVQGLVTLKDNQVSLQSVTAKHGKATLAVSGSGVASNVSWDLKLHAENVPLDAEVKKAIPAGLAAVLDSMKLAGTYSIDFPKLVIRESPAPATTEPQGSAVAKAGDHSTPLDVDFVTRITGTSVSADVAVAVADCNPTIELAGVVRRSKLDSLAGPIDAPAAMISSRPVKNLHLELYKPSGHDGLRIGNLRGQIASGEIAGNVDVVYPDNAPSKYQMNLVLKGADCRQLTGEADIAGELNASLALEGELGNPNVRRGRGDVSVGGKTLYKMPLVLGLLQITNLSLPLSSPFNEGSARYNVTGQKVTFESIEVRAKDLLISGSGQLDFGTKKVNLTFTTENPNWPKVPLLGDLVQSAKQELLQIHVKGTLQEPKVSATAMTTLTTTVDEVLKGEGR
ncbi:MAG TPA: hypothetical protein VF669_14480 [Tepidisphaeraceae bacterium]